MIMIKCIGCGSTLQTIDENKEGYISEETLTKHREMAYCKRCYQIQHYGKVTRLPFDLHRYKKQMSRIKKERAKVLLIIDVLDIYGCFNPVIIDAISESEVIILINKVDVLPKGIKIAKIENRVREIAYEKGLNVKKVVNISALKSQNVIQVIDWILKEAKQNVYLVGLANSGKSTFLNAVIKKYFNETKDIITTSYVHGTTYDLIKIPLEDNINLIDTPGLISNSQYSYYLTDKSMKIINPKKYLKPTIYQLNDNQTVYIGGLFRLDILRGENITVTTFLSNSLYVHRTKLENADKLYDNQVTKQLSPPSKDELLLMGTLKLKEEVKLAGEKKAIIIGGLGFIHLTGTNLTVRTFAPEMIDIKIVDPII